MKKLYIMLMANDCELIIKTIFKAGADKVCFITPEQKKNYRAVSDKVIRSLTNKLVPKVREFTEVDMITFKFNDYDNAMKSIIAYIKRNMDDYDITINVSVGAHVICALLINIASIFHLKLEYTEMTELNPRLLSEEDWHFGFRRVVRLPTIPANLNVSKKELKFLRLLDSKGSMIVQDYLALYPKKDENKRRAEFNYYVDKLKGLGTIDLKKVASRNLISLSNTGRIILMVNSS